MTTRELAIIERLAAHVEAARQRWLAEPSAETFRAWNEATGEAMRALDGMWNDRGRV